jgi:mannitol-1-phosphate 5-dehydrogenase
LNNYEIAIIGAGKTGRGFIGRLLQEAGLPFLMIDKNIELVEKLETAGSFEVEFFGGAREPMLIKDFKVEHTENQVIRELFSEIKLVFVSVGGSNLTEAGQWLAGVFEKRMMENMVECSFITCENANKPAQKLKDAFLLNLNSEDKEIAEKLYGFSEATVFCTTIEDGEAPLNILSENYPRLQCDAAPLKANLPEVKGLQPVMGFQNFLVRKIYTYNAASAAISYLGWHKGYKIYSDAANDEDILKLLKNLYEEVGKALCKAHGYKEEDQKEFAELSLKKFRDRTISDTIERNAREPHRKLAFNERIIGPALLIREYGGDSSALEITAAAALLYDNEADIEWKRLKESLGAEGILREFCKLEEGSLLAEGIMKYYVKLQKKTNCTYLLFNV